MWDINEKEIQNVTNLSAEKRYSYFIKKIVDWEGIWSLKSKEGWVMATNDAGSKGFPVWPHKVFAERCAKDQWSGATVEMISLNKWLEKWIPGMKNDNLQVAVFPTEKSKAVFVVPEKLSTDIKNEIELYE